MALGKHRKKGEWAKMARLLRKTNYIQFKTTEDLKLEVMIRADEVAEGSITRYMEQLIARDLGKDLSDI